MIQVYHQNSWNRSWSITMFSIVAWEENPWDSDCTSSTRFPSMSLWIKHRLQGQRDSLLVTSHRSIFWILESPKNGSCGGKVIQKQSVYQLALFHDQRPASKCRSCFGTLAHLQRALWLLGISRNAESRFATKIAAPLNAKRQRCTQDKSYPIELISYI